MVLVKNQLPFVALWKRSKRKVSITLLRFRRRLRDRLVHVLGRLRRVDQTIIIITAICIGILGGYSAIGFRKLISWTHQAFFATSEYSLVFLESMPWWQRILVPTLGGLLVGLITRLAPEVKGSGIPEVMEAVARRGGMIRFRVLITKALAAAVTIGSGGSVGREGPIVHIGSAIGSAFGQFFETSAQRSRTYVGCGAAAAVAATFNAPIAGALFAMEIVLGNLAVDSLSPIVISSVVATFISRHHLGDFPAFKVPSYESVHSGELILYAGLGVAAGIFAVFLIRLLYFLSDFFENLRLPSWLKPGLGGFGVGLIALGLPQVYGVGYESINAALWGLSPASLLIFLLVAKAVATSLSLGSGGSGGVFAPSLFMGACLGAGWGHMVNHFFPDTTASPGAYALVGMGAMVAASTHAPITAILIIFELTNDYRIIPPLMLACVIGVLLSGILHRESIYTAKLFRRGVRLRGGRDVTLLRSVTVTEVMNDSPEIVQEDMPFKDLIPRLLAAPNSELIIVNKEGFLAGMVSLEDLRTLLPDSDLLASVAIAADAAQTNAPFVLPNDHLDLVMHHFGRFHYDQIPVCKDSRSRFVIGAVTHDDIINAYNRRAFQLDLTSGFGSLVEAVQDGRAVEVADGIVLQEIDAPFSLVGRTLQEADLRRRYDVEVILIHTSVVEEDGLEGRPGRLPSTKARIGAGDRLLVMGSEEAISNLLNGNPAGV